MDQRLVERDEERGCDFAWMRDCREVMACKEDVERREEDRSSCIVCCCCHLITGPFSTNRGVGLSRVEHWELCH